MAAFSCATWRTPPFRWRARWFAAPRQFGRDRGQTGRVTDGLDSSKLTHLRHPARRQVAGVKATTFRLVYSALIPAALMIGHHFSISDGTQLGVGEFAGLRVVGMV
jgi:hypothetical protein